MLEIPDQAVTAEVASSSLVVPAIHSQELTETTAISRGHKKAQNRCRKESLANQGLRFVRFFREQERDHCFLRTALFGCDRLRVSIECHANC